MTISEKVAYIQGLFDGLGLDKERPGEARILFEVLDVLKEAGQRLDGMDAAMDRFGEELDELRDTVVDLEDAAFDSEDDRDYGEDDRLQLPCPTCVEDLLAVSFTHLTLPTILRVGGGGLLCAGCST